MIDMDIMAIDGKFAVGAFLARDFKYKWNEDANALSVWADKSTAVSVTTNRNTFIEAVNEGGEIVYEGGDGEWLHIPVGKKPLLLRYKNLTGIKPTKAEINKARKTVRRYVVSGQPYSLDIPNTVVGVIGWLNDHLKDIPKAVRDSASFSFDTTMEYGETYPRIEIHYSEPETDEEVITRLGIEKERTRISELKEREKFDSLKKKFG